MNYVFTSSTRHSASLQETSNKFPEIIHLKTRAQGRFGSSWSITANKTPGDIESDCIQTTYDMRIVDYQRGVSKVGYVSLLLENNKDFVRIEGLENSTFGQVKKKSEIRGIGSAGLEVAFRISYLVGRGGRIELFPISNTSFFYFTWGFRFHIESNTSIKDCTLQRLIKTYLTDSSADKEETERIIKAFSYLSDEELQRNASLVLGRDPRDFEEALLHGYPDTKDDLMALLLKHDKTPRNSMDMHAFFRSTMYLPTETITEKKREFTLQ